MDILLNNVYLCWAFGTCTSGTTSGTFSTLFPMRSSSVCISWTSPRLAFLPLCQNTRTSFTLAAWYQTFTAEYVVVVYVYVLMMTLAVIYKLDNLLQYVIIRQKDQEIDSSRYITIY